MKILHVYKDFFPPIRGGVEQHIALMCRYQRAWADVEALTCSRTLFTHSIIREGTAVTEVGEWGRLQSAPLSPLFPLYMRLKKADIVVVHVPNPTAELGYLLTRPRGKLVVRYHSDVIRQKSAMKLYGPLQHYFFQQADCIIPTSQPYLDTSPTLQRVKDRCRVIPLGIIADEFQHPDPSLIATIKTAIPQPYVLFSGVHRYYKGLEYLVKAASAINATVVIAGDGPERARCEKMAQDSASPIIFTGALSHEELVAYLHGCEVFVFPSIERSEAFGISMMEAHACGKPIVATRLGTGVEYVNLDGQTGYNVPPRDPAALATAVNTLLADVELRSRLGAFARQRVEQEFSAERVARQEYDLFMELLTH